MSFPITYHEQGSGDAIIFLHGVGGDGASWKFQLDHFSRRYRTIAWDMPGYGGSEDLTPMTFAGLSDSLARLLDHLEMERAHFVGHSMGGMVVQEFLVSHPDRAQSIVLSATTPAFGKSDGDFQKNFVAARIKPLDDGLTMADLARDMMPGMFGDGADKEGMRIAKDGMSSVPAATYRAAMECLVTFERRKALADISVPTLVLAGEKDSNAPASVMAKMATFIPGSIYREMAGAGHLANLEQPETFNRIIDEFLSSHKGS